jgi:hypothetical protein
MWKKGDLFPFVILSEAKDCFSGETQCRRESTLQLRAIVARCAQLLHKAAGCRIERGIHFPR